MRGVRKILWIIAVAVVALPLLLGSNAMADSGCHGPDGGTTSGTVASRGGSSNG